MKPDVLVTLDWETYHDKDYSLSKLTTEAYVRDPRFEAIGVGVKYADLPTVWMEEWEFREWAARFDWSRASVAAHHMQFDGLILSHHYGIRPGFLLCTMSMGRALHGSGALAVLGPLLGVGEKGDEVKNTKGKHRSDFTPEEWERYGEYCRNDVELTYGALHRMWLPEDELALIDMTIRMFTEPVFVGDQAVLVRALASERAKKAALLARVGRDPEVFSSSAKFAALLTSLGVEVPTKPGKKGPIPAFAKNDPGFKTLLEHESEEIRWLCEARLGVKSTLIETRTERLIGAAQRGPIPFYLNYCGAHTHRWSGGDGLNPQNFNRGGELRAAILAPDGYLLAVADSSQIEARVLAWLARQLDLLETFRRNDAKAERYKQAFAERVRVLGHEPSKDEEKQIDRELAALGIEDGDFYSDEGSRYFRKPLSKKETPLERQVSKSMVLGLGFGMGWLKFAAELLKGMLGADPVQFGEREAATFRVDVGAFEVRRHGKESTCGEEVRKLQASGVRLSYRELLVHCAVTETFVRMYRDSNAKITALWRSMGDVLHVMAAGGSKTIGLLRFVGNTVVKPNGMVLRYPHLAKRGEQFVYKEGHKWKKIYGGLFVENLVQSLARDVVATQALSIKARTKVGTTTHDEVVTVPRAERAAPCLAFMLAEMKRSPLWCADLPLNASGEVARSYGDCK